MSREEMIKTLIAIYQRMNQGKITDIQIQSYKERLDSMSDMQIQNIFMMNCG